MRCPTCRSIQTKVVDSRVRVNFDDVYRRRKCLDCLKTWKTYETYGPELDRLRALDQTHIEIRELAVHLYEKYGPPVDAISNTWTDQRRAA